MTALIDLYGQRDHQAIVHWICKEYGLGATSLQYNNEHRCRREKIATRLQLYRDLTLVPVGRTIDQIYDTDEMRQTLRKYIHVSVGQNVSRRIVNEIASIYDRPALRTLLDRNEEFHAEETRLDLHFIFQEAHRLTNLCNETLLWQFAGIDDKPSLRIVTPDAFDAVPDPRDRLVPAAYVIDFAPVSMLPDAQRLPHWELWDDTYRYRISGDGRLVDANGETVVVPEAHGLPRIPGVLLHRRQPTTCILDASYGEDIKSTHLAVALLDVMIMRLSKTQGENYPILQGNLAAMASGQTMTGERPLALPPDVVASVLNMKTDPDHYLKVKQDKIASCASTYGMSYEYFTQSEGDAGSGKAYSMRREKLTELRLEQRGRALKHEREVCTLIGFDADGMRVDFQEQAVPQDAGEAVDLLDKKMKKGLDSPVAFVMRDDPDLTREEAIEKIDRNLKDFAMLMMWVRALNMPANADASNPGKSPQENGADNAPKTPNDGDGMPVDGDDGLEDEAA
jgi:hypothetical protein